MKTTRQLAIVGALFAVAWLLAGCVSMGQVTPYSAEEQAVLDEYQRAAEKILGRMMREHGIKGDPASHVPNVRVPNSFQQYAAKHPAALIQGGGYGQRDLWNLHRAATIYLDRNVLAHPQAARVVLAHELGHFISGHTDTSTKPCASNVTACEEAANQVTPALLREGWGMAWREAVQLTYAYLVSAATTPAPAGGRPVGHEDPCGHVRAFATHFKLAVAQECQP